MKILVTGGAGYIGSFVVKTLLDKNHQVTVLDNLKRGHRELVDQRAELIQADITIEKDIENVFNQNFFDAVMHFAGLISVGESQEKPELYYQNNVVGSKNLFEKAISIGKINKFIFSSSAAVYGNPVKIPIPEDHPKNPISEYGKNKLAVEEVLINLNQELGTNSVVLRYFNAAGALLDASLGEWHEPETHIIPKIIKSAIKGTVFKLFGNDYSTKDGTCIRDYIHVLDLVGAHVSALEKLEKNTGAFYYNVGTGVGYSNKEVIEMVKKISGKDFEVEIASRRPGDSDKLVADPTKIIQELGFVPKYSDLETIVKTAWAWHNR
ncbi:MAG: UDP-glucose 4-epimerase GalE [Candidatus Levybacteria bacterium CG10_big_fil_rev_8_21_14_0_10_35_13]|nr:MAG: UDP-glucose 4-epimerase GalE [Candidatus Levybacteria bacterium CG10_big_fil_rev_8_21_14_0_10_35_13]